MVKPRIKRSPKGILKAYADGSTSLEESLRALELWKNNAVRQAIIKESSKTFGRGSQRDHRLRLGF
jgi:hypothetical protein